MVLALPSWIWRGEVSTSSEIGQDHTSLAFLGNDLALVPFCT